MEALVNCESYKYLMTIQQHLNSSIQVVNGKHSLCSGYNVSNGYIVSRDPLQVTNVEISQLL